MEEQDSNNFFNEEIATSPSEKDIRKSKRKQEIDYILREYKSRLVRLTRNKSICTSKITKKNNFDISTLKVFDENIAESVVDFLINRSKKSITLVGDFTSARLSRDDFFIKKDRDKDESLELKREELLKNSKHLGTVFSTIDEIEKETGVYELFIGYPFVEGRFVEGPTTIRGPLFLFPISLIKKGNEWSIENRNDEHILLNKTLFLGYKTLQFSGFNIPKNEDVESLEEFFSVEKVESDVNSFLCLCRKYLNSIDFILEEDSEESSRIERFIDYKKDDYSKYPLGKTVLKPYLLLGHFTVGSGSIYKDYEGMIENGITESIGNLLVVDNIESEEYKSKMINDTVSFKEEDLLSITELDYSQELAVKYAMSEDELIVHGPPGTGKSQVIANVVGNYLWKGKKVLLISEKRTALDVVYKRLQSVGLDERIGIVHDYKKDRKPLYSKIGEILLKYIDKDETSVNEEISESSENIQKNLDKLDRVANELKKIRSCGYSLRELYTLSKLDKEKYYRDLPNNLYRNLDKKSLLEITFALNKILPTKVFDNNKESLISYRKDFSKIDITKREYLTEIIEELLDIQENLDSTLNEKIKGHISSLIEKIDRNSLEIYSAKKSEEKKIIESVKNEIFKEILVDLNNLVEKIKYSQSEVQKKLLQKIENLKDFKNDLGEFSKLPTSEVFSNLKDINRRIREISSMFFLSFKKYSLGKELMREFGVNWKIDKSYLERIEHVFQLYDPVIQSEPKIIKYSGSLELTVKSIEEKIEMIRNEIRINMEIAEKLSKVKDDMVLINDKWGETYSFKEIKSVLEIENLIDNKYNLKISEERLLQLNSVLDFLRDTYEINTLSKVKEFHNYIKIDKSITGMRDSNKWNREIEEFYLKETKYKNRIKEYLETNNTLKAYIDSIKENKIPDSLSLLEKEIIAILERDKNNSLYLENGRKIQEELTSITSNCTTLERYYIKINELTPFFNSEIIPKLQDTSSNLKLKTKALLNTARNEFTLLKNHDYTKSTMSQLGLEIYNYIIREQGSSSPSENVKKFQNTVFIRWIDEIESTIQEEISYLHEYKDLKARIEKEQKSKRELAPSAILRVLNKEIKLQEKFNRVGNEVNLRAIQTEVLKKRNVLPIRELVTMFQDKGIFQLLPVWLLTPKVAAEILPLEKELFDIVMFDEASQMFVEYALPFIYRSKKVLIAGDDKQLQPLSLGQKFAQGNEENIEEDEYSDGVATDEKSLLDVAKLRFSESKLLYHYRAKYEELINFSNYYYYDGKLITPPDLELNSDYRAIERILVKDGVWSDKRNNIREAEEVYKLLKEIFENREKNESIGIITFNASQQDLIKEYLEECSIIDSDFGRMYGAEKSRIEESEDKSIFVKNIENVQGDERDIIIFSTGYAKDNGGKLKVNFGSLNQSGGENRLNVAISRAKRKIYLITSFEPEELNVENTLNKGPKDFKQYLLYGRAISNGRGDIGKEVLGINHIKAAASANFSSPFEEEVYKELENLGYNVHSQVGDSGYRIDLAIYDTEKRKYILGIECDGKTYHSSSNARERDIYRQKFLENKGWNIHRVWSYDWWNNPQGEIEKIKKIVENLR